MANLCGRLDEHLRQIEDGLDVKISNRGNLFRIVGSKESSKICEQILNGLYKLAKEESLNPENVHIFLQESRMEKKFLGDQNIDKIDLSILTKRIRIRPRGANQKSYVRNLRGKDLCFGIGPAGTGKTYLAVACAIESLYKELVSRIVLVRPAVEAGERLGFLPGDMSQKVDPYLRPIYDALYEMIGLEEVSRLIERNIIEIAPLAYMRGRSLKESYVILDEAQNTTPEQMKMFLTRIGFGSKAVVTGDITQVDLPNNQYSGLKDVIQVLGDVEEIGFSYFESVDAVRHPLVQKVIEAYYKSEYGKLKFKSSKAADN
ncbi:MAG: PhoH family protein [Pseudomonadota bacterium]|nr:PhoH family protein [Pseudomonadota bacterium]